MAAQQRRFSLFGPIIITIFVLFSIAGIYADWLWFDSVGYLEVFRIGLVSRILAGIGIFAAFFGALYLNAWIVSRRIPQVPLTSYLAIIFSVSLLASFLASNFWMTIQRFSNYVGFGIGDPVFNHDIGFYLFVIPFYRFLIVLVIALVVLSLVLTMIMYLVHTKKKKVVQVENEFSVDSQLQAIKFEMPEKGKAHLAFLGGLLLLCLGAFFFLRKYSVLLSKRGVVYGAGYTDIHVMLPLYIILTLACIIVAILCFSYPYVRNFRLLVSGLIVLGVILFGGILVASLVQKMYVEPNEFNLEKPYLERNIQHTLYAYDLREVKVRDFEITSNLTMKDITSNEATIENVRLWDWRPLLPTNRQLQLFRSYYDFVDVDVDRYEIDGKLRQVMISPRELDQQQLDEKAKTWVNQKFVYTHGYGLVASPVNVVTQEGLPELFVQDIPPKSKYANLEVEQPGIYFGEKTNDYVIVKSQNKEFDYPLGNDNMFTVYGGKDGVSVSNAFEKAAFSIKLGSLNLFVSSAIDDESKLLMYRNIKQRANIIAPFLGLENDPYLVINEGKLFWIIDAYTTSSFFPYSEPLQGFNYIRNSVKIVIDAYEGSIDFYIVDDKDPIIQNYAKIFPMMFKPLSAMPKGLQEHIRYPEDMMYLQSLMYGTYHMLDSQVFYNKEDVWRIPNEKYGNEQVEMRPYFVIMKLPQEAKEGFYLIQPLIPRGKENLIAWFTASSDPQTYGTLEVFKMSKQELTYGPMQIEARIDQDTAIAQLLTLWNQQGSEVIRGNLMIIPIEHTFLYIEPVYLKASAQGALPQLKRVIVAYEDKVTMQESLEEALEVIFDPKNTRPAERPTVIGGQPTAPADLRSTDEKFAEASRLYGEAQAALQQGNFALYGEKIQELGRVLGK